MNELLAILKAAGELDRIGEAGVLATVVRVEGSSYRRPGARMLATVAGRRIGSVSGGCLEKDVIRRTWEESPGGEAIVISYDSTAEDDGLWGLGLGCNGKIFILAQRLLPGEDHGVLNFVRESLASGRACVVGTVFGFEGAMGVKVGGQFVVDSLGKVGGDGRLIEMLGLAGEIENCLSLRRSEVRRISRGEGWVDLLVEFVEPAPRLLVVGAGFDAVPVVNAASALGWRVAVADGRAGHATKEHFPEADEWVVCPAEEIAERARVDDRTYVVMMTHRYPDDLAALPGLLKSAATYVGMLGPEHRKKRLLEDLASEGKAVDARLLGKLFGPVGLDIGADTPGEIAASIVAEIVAFRAGREGGHLREFDGPIHDRFPASRDVEGKLCPTKLD